jgi:SAM-dependent methyltransferase
MEKALLTHEGELSCGRDFSVYVKGMDAGLALKINDIVPHIRPGRIVDKGCANGSLLVHLSALFPTSSLVGIDLSPTLLSQARKRRYVNNNVTFVRGNMIKRSFDKGTIDTAIFASNFHEVYSYNDYDRAFVRETLETAREEAVDRGRLIMRDGVSPINNGTDENTMNHRHTWLRCDQETERLFRRFAVDFKGKSKNPGVPFTERRFDGVTFFKLSLHHAAEFLSKKDYLENWDIEVNEEFGVYGFTSWRKVFADAGFRIIEEESYVNPWVRANRYVGKAALFAIAKDGRPGSRLPFPKTTIKIAAEAI